MVYPVTEITEGIHVYIIALSGIYHITDKNTCIIIILLTGMKYMCISSLYGLHHIT